MFLAFRHLRCFFLLYMSGSPLWLLTSSNRAWSQTKFFVVKTAVAYTYFTVMSRRTFFRSSINLKLSWISRWTVGWCFYRLGSNGHWLGIVRQEKHRAIHEPTSPEAQKKSNCVIKPNVRIRSHRNESGKQSNKVPLPDAFSPLSNISSTFDSYPK